MAKENVLDPEINLIKSDEFYLFYEMMVQSLKTDDVKEGMNKSLSMLRAYLRSGNVAIFRKNAEGKYVFKMSDSEMKDVVATLGCIVNKTKPLTERQGIFNLNLNFSERLNNIMLIHIGISDNNSNTPNECILAVLNTRKKELEPQFWDRTKDTMQIILKRAASYERNKSAITQDLLTGLDNRNSYEMRVQSLNECDSDLIVAVFDLFRLKFINDNFTHIKGDAYIKETANILSKYWPKQTVVTNADGTESYVDTGHCVYRVGGDEFVLLTNKEELPLTTVKSGLASDEACMIDLGVDEELTLGINYGVVKHNPGDFYKNTFIRADEKMQQDKALMYKKYNLDRRR